LLIINSLNLFLLNNKFLKKSHSRRRKKTKKQRGKRRKTEMKKTKVTTANSPADNLLTWNQITYLNWEFLLHRTTSLTNMCMRVHQREKLMTSQEILKALNYS